MIFSSAVLRIYTKEPKAKALRHVMVQNVLLKNLFGKIIQNSLKTSLEDLIKLTNRAQKKMRIENKHLYDGRAMSGKKRKKRKQEKSKKITVKNRFQTDQQRTNFFEKKFWIDEIFK